MGLVVRQEEARRNRKCCAASYWASFAVDLIGRYAATVAPFPILLTYHCLQEGIGGSSIVAVPLATASHHILVNGNDTAK